MVTTTISDLPNDVILQIFPFCVPGPYTLPPLKNDPRLIISQICSRWRHLILEHSPAVWADLELRPASHTRVPCSSITSGNRLRRRGQIMVQYWMMRTGILPLSFKAWSPIPGFAEDWMVSPMQDIIAPFSTRFRKLEMALPESRTMQLLSYMPGSFPLLEELKLMGYNTAPGGVIRFPRLEGAILFPALRNLSLSFSSEVVDIRELGMPWNQLRKLELLGFCCAVNVGMDVMGLCKETLEEVFMTLQILPGKTTATPTHEVLLPKLHALKICFVSTKHTRVLPLFLQPLIAPRLKSISIQGGSIQWSHDAFHDLVHRSSCAIEELCLYGLDLDEEMDASVRGTPWLKSLTFSLKQNVEALLPGFVEDMSKGVWVPRLEYLGIYLKMLRDPGIQEVVNLILVAAKLRLELRAGSPQHGGAGSTNTILPTMTVLRQLIFAVPYDYESLFHHNHGSLLEDLRKLGCSVSLGSLATWK